MAFQIDTEQDEQLFAQYTALRNDVRNVMAHGVYPNLVKALAVYAALDAAFAEGGDLADAELAAYHASLMTPIAPYIAALLAAAQQIVSGMQAVEAASPGTFGIAT